MTASELKFRVKSAGHESFFFAPHTMKFFGDSMSNYGCRLATIVCDYDRDGNYAPDGFRTEAWELWRKRPVKHGLQASAYFDPFTFKRIFPR